MSRRKWTALLAVGLFLVASTVVGRIAFRPLSQTGVSVPSLAKGRPEPLGIGGVAEPSFDNGEIAATSRQSAKIGSAPAQAPAPVTQGPVQDLATLPQADAVAADLPGAKVVKTASVEIEIGDGTFQDKFTRAGSIAEQSGGFVSHSSTSETNGKVSSGTIVIRVPADKFQSALGELKALGKVTADSQTGTDVTQEFIDLEARIRHLRTQEAFYLKLMNEAKSISDMIQIQERLSGVQSQIEQIQGRLQYLNDQTSFSSITASIFEPAALLEPKGIGKAIAEAWAAFQTMVSHMIVGAGWLLPLAFLGALGLGTWRAVRRRPSVAPAK